MAAAFELNVVLAPDARFAATMRDLAAHAARYAGCGDEEAARYGEAVEEIVLTCLGQAPPDGDVPIVVRHSDGPVEFLIACAARFESATRHEHISIDWTHERGGPMCRVTVDP